MTKQYIDQNEAYTLSLLGTYPIFYFDIENQIWIAMWNGKSILAEMAIALLNRTAFNQFPTPEMIRVINEKLEKHQKIFNLKKKRYEHEWFEHHENIMSDHFRDRNFRNLLEESSTLDILNWYINVNSI